MRIIAGAKKGYIIKAPSNLPSRPTTDRAKESIFNIMSNYFYFDNLEVLDLFAGTGNISFEFASRYAKSIVSVDKNFKCVQFIKAQANRLKIKNIKVIKSDVIKYIRRDLQQFDIIFADPPYKLENMINIVDLIFERQKIKPNGWIILEHSANNSFQEHKYFYEQRKYGQSTFSIFKIKA